MKMLFRFVLAVILISIAAFCFYKINERIISESAITSGVSFKIDANRNAPVFETQQIFIEAAPEKVWQALTEINQWPVWQENVTAAELHGRVAAGVAFNWKAGGLSFESKIHTCNSVQYFGWTGKTIGAFAIHNWKIKRDKNGTLVEVEESLDGILPVLFSKKFSEMLKKGMSVNLNELKARSVAQ